MMKRREHLSLQFLFCVSSAFLLPFFFFIFSLLASDIIAQEMNEFDKLIKEGVKDGITVDLREPVYSNGILSTDKGGLISGPQLRIQATCLSYTHHKTASGLIWTLEAKGDLLVEFGDY